MSAKQTIAAQITTLETRIAADTTKLDALRIQLEQADLLDAVTVGTVISFKIGRAETRRNVDGTVKAVKTEEDGSRKFKVEYTPTGDEFDNTFAVVLQSQIDRVVRDEHGNEC